MKEWLPSKRIVLRFGVPIIIVVGLILVVQNNQGKISYKDLNKKDGSIATKILIQKTAEKDTDGDGLKDWEENLWKTDINNIDTDGDGTSDNDEILQNRNPLKPGPDDEIKNKLKKEDVFNDKNITETEKVGRELLLGYIGLKQQGLLNKETQEKLIESVLKESFVNNNIKKYSINDIQIIGEDKNSLEEYGNEIINIMKKNIDVEDDLIIFKNMIENESDEELKKLNQSVIRYENAIKEILELSVPKIFIQNHINILNSMSNMKENIKGMTIVFEDPMEALVNLNDYIKNREIIVKKFAEIGKVLKENGITIGI